MSERPRQRHRRIGSVKNELLAKAREAALAAVQIFNNPTFCFKSEAYIVLMVIAWTYLLHAYYRQKKIEYRYFNQKGKRKVFERVKDRDTEKGPNKEKGPYKFWDLHKCITTPESPLDRHTANNLKFLLKIRHEIEHQMTTRIDDFMSAKFQACCLNFNEYIKQLFGPEYGIERHLSFSLQFVGIDMDQKNELEKHSDLPKNIKTCITDFENSLSKEERENSRYAYRLLYVPTNVNHPGQADKVIQFITPDSPLAKGINTEYALIKEREREKFLPGQIIQQMHQEGFIGFRQHEHTKLVAQLQARNSRYGTNVANSKWYWYASWLNVVRKHCQQYANQYRVGKQPVFPVELPEM